MVGTVLVLAVVVIVVLGIWSLASAHRWEGSVPPVPRFAQPKPPSGSLRASIRRDGNASIEGETWRFLWLQRRRYWFVGTGCPPHKLMEHQYEDLSERRITEPVLLAASGERQYWWWGEEFYWDNGRYTPEDVRAVVLKHERQNRKELEHARDLLAIDGVIPGRKREPIPEEVRRFVFRRDGGRCQNCGSQELLQYDHVIPFSMGGSSEPENLQLLCAPCNKAKSGRL
jgi:HNH endonuclease